MSSEIVIGQKLTLGRSHLVHKPIDPKNLSKKFQKDYEQKPYKWELKYDGCHMIVAKLGEGEVGAWSREGNPVKSMDHVLAEVDESYPVGTVLFGEAYSAALPFEEISGIFRRQYTDANPQLCYMVFDRIDVDEFLNGEAERPYWARRETIQTTGYCVKTYDFFPETVAAAQAEVDKLRETGLVYGLDGFIAADLTAHWIAGAGKGGEKIKVKNHVSVDLMVYAVLSGEGKFANTAGVLRVKLEDGTCAHIGCGTMSNEERDAYYANPALIVGKYVEIHALGYTTAGKLREPRFHRTRFDKS
jgi:ATP-dependent DNA ligase